MSAHKHHHGDTNQDSENGTIAVTSATAAAFVARHDEAEAAFARVEPELAGVTELARIVTDIPRTVTTVLGVVPKLTVLRPRIVEELTKFPITRLDKLEDYALATGFAHAMTAPPSSFESPVQPVLEEALPLRRKLLKAAELHVEFGDFNEQRVAEIKVGSGYADAAMDLIALAGMFREAWDRIDGRTRVTKEQVDRAAEIGTTLLKLLGKSGASNRAAGDRRTRAYTLLLDAYDQCRRAVWYLRWDEGDVDEIIPSLFVKSRSAKGTTPTPDPEPAPAPPAPAPAPPTPAPSPDGNAQPA